jgi:hypothetical protein
MSVSCAGRTTRISPEAFSQQPGDVLGVEAVGPRGGGRNYQPVEALVADQLPQRVPVGAPPLDARVDGDAGRGGPRGILP